jgi:hypothetical protein
MATSGGVWVLFAADDAYAYRQTTESSHLQSLD